MQQTKIINSFNLGVINNIPKDQIPDNAVVRAINYILDKRTNLRTRPGVSRLNSNDNLAQSIYNDFSGWTKVGALIYTNNNGAYTSPVHSENTVDSFSSASSNSWIEQSFSANPNTLYTVSFYVSVEDLASASVFNLRIEARDSVPTVLDFTDFLYHATIFSGSKVQAYHSTNPKNSGFLIDYNVESINNFWVRIQISILTPASTNDLVVRFANNGHSLIVTDDVIKIDSISKRWLNDSTDDSDFSSLVFSSVASGTVTGIWGFSLRRGTINLNPIHNSSTDATISGNYLTGKITSIYHFCQDNGSRALLVTAGNKVYRYSSANKWFEDISGGLSFPSDTKWTWITYDNMAIGCNTGNPGTYTNTVKIVDTSSNCVALGGTPPGMTYITLFKDRLWYIKYGEENIVGCSKLGDVENYTTTGRAGAQEFEIGGQEGNIVTLLYPLKDRLICAKQSSTYALLPGSPDVDIWQYQNKLIHGEVGCIAPFTAKEFLGDLVWLSHGGLVPLSALEIVGRSEVHFLTQNIIDFEDVTNAAFEAHATLNLKDSQYIITFPIGTSGVNNTTYVLDYTYYAQGILAFTEFSGKFISSCLNRYEDEIGREVILIGGYTIPSDAGNSYVYEYDPEDENNFLDDYSDIRYVIETKAYNFDRFLANQLFHRFSYSLELLSNSLELGFTFIFDGDEIKKVFKSSILSGDVFIGGKWDEMLWDTGIWATTQSPIRTKTIKLSSRRVGQNLAVIITIPKSAQGFILKGIGFVYSPLTARRLNL